jgi:outer membrane receptor protein involved in Fe transport
VAGNNIFNTLAITEAEEEITDNTTNIVRARPLPGRTISMTLSYSF